MGLSGSDRGHAWGLVAQSRVWKLVAQSRVWQTGGELPSSSSHNRGGKRALAPRARTLAKPARARTLERSRHERALHVDHKAVPGNSGTAAAGAVVAGRVVAGARSSLVRARG